MKRLGNYQKTVLKGIAREGSQPYSIRKGYSKQVRTLRERKLIKKQGSRLYLTKAGRNRI